MNQLTPLPSAFSCPRPGRRRRRQGEASAFLNSSLPLSATRTTRRAYSRAVADFMAWCHQHGLESLIDIEPLHVATWIEAQVQAGCADAEREAAACGAAAPVRLACRRADRPDQSGGVRARPAAHRKGGKTPVLIRPRRGGGCCQIDGLRKSAVLRDGRLIALMVYSFARVGAALRMKVEDVFTQSRGFWLRLQ